jgi:hypothetical protein
VKLTLSRKRSPAVDPNPTGCWVEAQETIIM